MDKGRIFDWWSWTFKMAHPPIITSHPCTNQLTRLAWIVSSKFLVSFLYTQLYSLDMIWWVPGWYYTLRCNLSIQQLLTLHPGLSLHTLDLFLQVWCVLCVSTYITNELIVSTDFSFALLHHSLIQPNVVFVFMLLLVSTWSTFYDTQPLKLFIRNHQFTTFLWGLLLKPRCTI